MIRKIFNIKRRLEKKTRRNREEEQKIKEVKVEEEQAMKTFKQRPSYYCYRRRRSCATREAGTCLAI